MTGASELGEGKNSHKTLLIIHDDINRNRARRSREGGNPERHWIPEPAPYLIRGQARNDKQQKIYVVVNIWEMIQLFFEYIQ
jgi:hypothetical protein